MALFPWASEPRFATPLLERLPIGVAVYRLETPSDASSLKLRFLNAAGEQATGLRAADEVGRTVGEIMTGPESAVWGDTFANVARTGVARDLGVVTYGDDRIASRSYSVQVVPLPGHEVAVLFEDVADRQRLRALLDDHAERAVEQERYRALVEGMSDIVWQTAPSGRFETDQPSWRAFTGQTEEELMGWGWLQAVYPDDRSATEAAWTAALEARSEYRVEHRLRRADGTYRRMRVRSVPVIGDAGKPVEWIGVHTDIEGEHEVANALAASEARFRTLFDAITDVLLLYPIGPDGPEPLVAFNEAATDLYGYSPDELRAMTLDDLVDSSHFETTHALEELRRTRRSRFESVHLARDGRRIPMQVSARLVELDGQLHVLSVCRDDTENRAFQRQMSRENLDLERRAAARTAELEAFTEDLKLLHGITTVDYPSVEALMQAFLTAGCAMFEMPIGILSAVEPGPSESEKTYRIAHVVSPGDAVEPGLAFPLSDAFCDAVVATENTVTYADAAKVEALACHSAYAERGLRSFIGTPIWDGEALIGTLNFVSPEPRADDFAPYERELVEVMADTISTRLVQAREARARADTDALHRSVLEAASDGIYGLDAAGRTTFVNPSAVALTGWTESEQMGVRQHELIHHHRSDGSPYPTEHCPIYQTLRDGVARDCDEEVFWHKDGSAIPVAFTVTPLMEHGAVRGAVVVFRRRAAVTPVAALPAVVLPAHDAPVTGAAA